VRPFFLGFPLLGQTITVNLWFVLHYSSEDLEYFSNGKKRYKKTERWGWERGCIFIIVNGGLLRSRTFKFALELTVSISKQTSTILIKKKARTRILYFGRGWKCSIFLPFLSLEGSYLWSSTGWPAILEMFLNFFCSWIFLGFSWKCSWISFALEFSLDFHENVLEFFLLLNFSWSLDYLEEFQSQVLSKIIFLPLTL